ncbi:MerR family transcriptional regulator [Kineococcus sp. G2]|uniref:MerR family transcriptional regulator n=1 Tax=Kineococcus sp. G2 TaxID=3127484 RepID=UPI00301C4590
MTNPARGIVRTGEVAHRVGCSVQQVRKLERTGVLPAAQRSQSGYRTYGERHLRSALAYRALAVAIGPLEAGNVMRGVHSWPLQQVLSTLDAIHAGLDAERRLLAAATRVAAAVAAEAVGEVHPADAMSVSELAGALGLRASTLRHWEAVGLVVPGRDGRGHRRYDPLQVRDARLVQQLRMSGYRVQALREVMPQLQHGGGDGVMSEALLTRARTVTERSRALLEAAAHLHAVVS